MSPSLALCSRLCCDVEGWLRTVDFGKMNVLILQRRRCLFIFGRQRLAVSTPWCEELGEYLQGGKWQGIWFHSSFCVLGRALI